VEDQKQFTVVRQTNGVKEVGTAGLDKENIQSVTVNAMPIWQLVLVRVMRMYIQSLLGLLTLDGLGVIKMEGVLEDWSLISSAMLTALAPTFISFMQNTLEFLTKLDVKNPAWRA
jgi:hypothetical protein